jgi:ribosomal protein S18 acetylase RimI-like enzyme
MFYIMTLGSSEKFRGRGLGSKLINECINICEQVPSCGVIYLHVITYNSTAIRFYERLGFHRIKEIKDYYTIHNESYNCYLYAKFVNGKILGIFMMRFFLLFYIFPAISQRHLNCISSHR